VALVAGLWLLGSIAPIWQPAARGAEAGAASADKPTAGSLRLYVFDCGRIRIADISAFGIQNDETDVREFAVPCYVVDHPKGRLLWDGGLPSSAAASDGWLEVSPGMDMRLEATLADQLKTLGLDMGSFDYAAYSHFHWDHVGVANEVEDATLLVQDAEYEASFSDQPPPGFRLALYQNLRSVQKKVLGGDHDVFGDGKVRILRAPGHTPGHQVLFVDLETTGAVVLSGDLYHFRLSRADRRVPGFNTSHTDTVLSFDRVESFLVDNDAQLWIEHELALFETQRLAPAFYD
jgi:glyoxylase-like metal-dependent hydrolase (beta-lactamase superfamily II)